MVIMLHYKQLKKYTFGLNMITLPSHTSNVLQPLCVCLKPFKTTLRKVRNAIMF
jgi:hypothetical protein